MEVRGALDCIMDGRPPVRTTNIFADAECCAACRSDRDGKAYEKNVALRESQVPAGFTSISPDKERGADQLEVFSKVDAARAWFAEHDPGASDSSWNFPPRDST
jgi:hypothetical protein